MKAFYRAKGDTRRKDSAAHSRCIDFLPRLKISQFTQKRQLQFSLWSTGSRADALFLCSLHIGRHLAVLISNKHHLGHVVGNGRRLADQSAVGDDWHVGGDAILATPVDLDRVPPSFGTMVHHHGRNQAEGRAFAIAKHTPKVIVVLLKITQAVVLGAEFLVFGEKPVVFRLQLIERHQIRPKAPDAVFHNAPGMTER